jgi:hypothetical protein
MTRWGGLFSSQEEELEKDRQVNKFKKELEGRLNKQMLNQKAELDLELTRLTDDLS